MVSQGVKNVPQDALEALATLLNEVENSLSWPLHIIHNWVVLMGKPGGGTRPIALMPMLYRVWTKVRRSYLQAWENEHCGSWDAATNGNSALRAALLSLFHDEVGSYSSEEVGTLLFDMEKFYDNVDLARLMAKAEATEYPPILMALGMQMHMAQRELKCYSSFPGKCLPRNGIIAAVSYTHLTLPTKRIV